MPTAPSPTPFKEKENKFMPLCILKVLYLIMRKYARLEDEEAGQIPIAYVVRAANSHLTENQVIQFVGSQVCC